MKFGARLKSDLYPDWANKYIDYSGLKKELKKQGANEQWDDTLEESFIVKLKEQLTKVADFQRDKIDEIWSDLDEYQGKVDRLMKRQKEHEQPHDGQEDHHDIEAGSDVEDSIEEDFTAIEEELETLIWETHEISKFAAINFTGFAKITKKHDKLTSFPLKQAFIAKYVEGTPLQRQEYDSLIIELSKLYNLVRTRGHPVVGDSAAGGGQSDFIRQTTKYWVHKDNLVNLKLAILKHLPVLVFDPEKHWDKEDSAISSIYFDNEDLDLYLGRLEKTEGAQAIRLRWYGGMGVKQIFVERKTHREDWTGEKSIKARFPLKEDQVNAYLRGELDIDATFEPSRKKAKKQSDVDANIRLAKEVVKTVAEKKLVPVVRTFYQRTAFQLPGDARVRISLDEDLTLIREDNWDGRNRAGKNWRRMDIGVNFPFEDLPEEDINRFPYGVLEVKLQTQAGQEPPEWAKELVSSHLVEAVPKFSKFIHGCATLLDTRVPLVPFWLPQMDINILKPEEPAKKAAIIRRPQAPGSRATPASSTSTSVKTPDIETALEPSPYAEPVSDDEQDGGASEDEHHGDLKHVAKDEGARTGVPHDLINEAKAFREQNRGQPSASVAKPTASAEPQIQYAKLTPANLERLLQEKYGNKNGAEDEDNAEEEAPRPSAPGGLEYVSSFKAPSGKLVSVPIRIEPKVYFANERTYLSWLEFSVLISAIGVGLMNFSNPNDPIGLGAGISFTIIALLSIVYAGGMFYWRAQKIRARQAAQFHDRIGPSAICAILFAAVAINFTWRLSA